MKTATEEAAEKAEAIFDVVDARDAEAELVAARIRRSSNVDWTYS